MADLASEARIILYSCSCLQLFIAELFETEGPLIINAQTFKYGKQEQNS